MNHSLLALIIAGLIALLPRSGDPTRTNEYVKFTVSSPQKTLKPGSSSQLLITLTPKAGIHINLQPPLDLRVDSIPGVTLAGSPEIPRRDSFLDVSKPIRQNFSVAGNLSPGPLTIRGMLVYYYCSDAEGWCSRFKQPFEVRVAVAR